MALHIPSQFISKDFVGPERRKVVQLFHCCNGLSNKPDRRQSFESMIDPVFKDSSLFSCFHNKDQLNCHKAFGLTY